MAQGRRAVDDTAFIRSKFSSFLDFFENGNIREAVRLPGYSSHIRVYRGVTVPHPLMWLDVVDLMRTNYWRARLLLYETERKSRPIAYMIPGKSIKLKPEALELDQLLVTISEDQNLGKALGWSDRDTLRNVIFNDPDIVQLLSK